MLPYPGTWAPKAVLLFGGCTVRCCHSNSSTSASAGTFTPQEPRGCSSHHFHQASMPIKARFLEIKKLKQSTSHGCISSVKDLFFAWQICVMKLKFWRKRHWNSVQIRTSLCLTPQCSESAAGNGSPATTSPDSSEGIWTSWSLPVTAQFQKTSLFLFYRESLVTNLDEHAS